MKVFRENAKILPNGRRIMGNRNFQSSDIIDSNIQDTINSGTIYQLGTELRFVDQSNFASFEDLIDYLISKDIEIELYLPSFHPGLYPQRCGVTEEDFVDMLHLYPDNALDNYHIVTINQIP